MRSSLLRVYHFALAFLGSLLYRFPARSIFVLGVTGTKGKSTVLELINAILEEAGKSTALLSSVRIKVGSDNVKNMTSTTMPGRFFIQRFLRRAVNAGCQYALIEVTSEGILRFRHRFISFDAALITNLHPEHVEAHGSFENYRQAKVDFFSCVAASKKKPKYFFVNEEDLSKDYFVAAAQNAGEITFFGREQFIENEIGARYALQSRSGNRLVGDWLRADFNLENAAAAVAFAQSQGIDWPVIERALNKFKGLPGRLEFIQKQPFTVVIDYAHTPDSLEKVYKNLKSRMPSRRRFICVLGAAGGGRDKWKRPVMGKIASKYCSETVLTNEDPYDEDPNKILEDIEGGFPGAVNYRKILDRKEAIRAAITSARRGDMVVITGKGSEVWMRVAEGKKLPWDEKKIVLAALKFSKGKFN
ncbi:MAG: UDP-N-acetylmuramyl-tripeptide synthetase [Parcubacteria group bacterium]|nr:UDP-N-acetylmuramyl-tripeptide synthetase [Parcubacteria group bacterium]